jgi:AraC-like DNA-binding protein
VRRNNPKSTDLLLVELASFAPTSAYRFARLFNAKMGIALHSHVIQQCILEAQRLLKSGRAIAEIASVTGVASQAQLSLVFRKRFGLAPINLRKQMNRS